MNRLSRSSLISAAIALGVGLSGPVLAGDPAAGKEKSVTCQACHGTDGNSPIPTFPIIAGQHKDYLAYSMLSYKTGERTNPIMVAIVQPLSEEDIEDLAAYYASQEGLYQIDAGLGSGTP